VRPDGSLVFGGVFLAMFYEHDWVQQVYVLQEDVDRIRIHDKRVPGGTFDGLSRVVREAMGKGRTAVWEEVDEVPRSRIGRCLHARSLVREARAGLGRPERDPGREGEPPNRA